MQSLTPEKTQQPEKTKQKEKVLSPLERLLCPQVISALTPLVIAAIGGTIGLTIVLNDIESPEGMGFGLKGVDSN